MMSETDPTARILMLGPFGLIRGSHSTTRFRQTKEIVLLAYLALNPQKAHSRDRLIDLLWPDAEPQAARANLNNVLSGLRRQLEAEGISKGSVLLTDRHTVALNPQRLTTDVADFDARLHQARSASLAERARLLEQAVALYRGDLLEGYYEEWQLRLQSAYRDRFREALVDWSQDLETQQEWEGAQQAAQRAMEVDPLQEDAILVLMRVLARQGKATKAIETYRAFQDRLCEELGADPTQAMQLFAERLQCAPDTFLVRRSPLLAFPSPFKEGMEAPDHERIALDDTEIEAVADDESGARKPFEAAGIEAAEIAAKKQGEDEAILAVERDEVASDVVPANNLPNWLTSFIGREHEIAEVCELLGQTRLLTLTGIGGCGKTRLAVRVASEVLGRYPQGVWLVALAALSDASLVAQAVADVLGVREIGGASMISTLCSALKGKRLLLVLDNCEHLLDACAVLSEALLISCPDLGVLATSREVLGLGGERAYRVPSMSCPPVPALAPVAAGDGGRGLPLSDRAALGLRGIQVDPSRPSGSEAVGLTLESLSRYESVRLFLERVAGTGTGFTLTASNAFALASLCSRLDGLPLAIELAASRARSMPLDQIESRLDDRFRLLTGGSRAALPRQRTLKALIDWSYDLLTEEEKALLNRLSVFAGGWTLAAAEALCGEASNLTTEDTEGHRGTASLQHPTPNTQHPAMVLDLLTSLVDKSLVIYDEREGRARYQLLETVRQYARDRLLESRESDAVRVRHLDYFLAFAEQGRPKLEGQEQAEWFHRFDEEHDNLRAALQCSLHTSTALLTLRLCGLLDRFWWTRGHFSEGREWCERALGAVGAQDRTKERANTLHGLGNLAERQRDYATARTSFAQSCDIHREIGGRREMGAALHGMGTVAMRQHDYAAARAYYEESLAISREMENRSNLGATLCNLGIVAKNQGDYAAAQAYYEESAVLFREIGHRQYLAAALMGLGRLADTRNDYCSARAHYEESLNIFQEMGDRWGMAAVLDLLGGAVHKQGDPAAARANFAESLDIYRELGEQGGTASVLHSLGRVSLDEGGHAAARAYFEQSLVIFREIGDRLCVANNLFGLGRVAKALGDRVLAWTYHQESLVLYQEIGDPSVMTISLETLASLGAEDGKPELAVALWATAEALRAKIGAARLLEETEEHDRAVAEVRRSLGAEAFAASWTAGRAMTMEEAVALALERPIEAD
jgi:non-specific serine/threonine protein kinase